MTKVSLLWKLTLAFLMVALTATAIVALSIRMTSADRLMEMIVAQQRSSLQSSLETYYATNGSWENIESRWQQIVFRSPAGDDSPPDPLVPIPWAEERRSFMFRGGERDRRSLFGLADDQGRVIIPVDGNYPASTRARDSDLRAGEPVMVAGKRVGTILVARLSPRLNPEESLFLQRTNTALLFGAGGAVLIALLIGIILARTIIHPLHALTQAAQNIASGQLEQQVRVEANDEIGQLAGAFNRMSQEVVRVNQQRKQMTADIAHDLRTPLTVIAGYVESMRDGVLRPTPERFDLIYTEIERLQNLVDDLRMLSQVDAGELPLHPHLIPPVSLLEHAAAPFQHRAGQQQVTVTIQAEPNLPELAVDEGRMMQVFGNLLVNALRYTPEGGQIALSAARDGDWVVLAVQDSGTGIPAEALPHIFDRFQRGDKSRHSETGESGLGLAIVKALVEAHGGRVRAQSVYGQGARIEVLLPIPPSAAA